MCSEKQSRRVNVRELNTKNIFYPFISKPNHRIYNSIEEITFFYLYIYKLFEQIYTETFPLLKTST